MKKIILLTTSFIFISCTTLKENKTQEIAERFFEIYSARKETQKIISFYSDEFTYENIAFESETNDPKFLYEQFYGWQDSNFKFESNKSIALEQLLTNDSTIIARGSTLPYTYNGNPVAGTRFVIYIELDKNLKIKKQTDWFDYPIEEIIEAYNLKKSIKIE